VEKQAIVPNSQEQSSFYYAFYIRVCGAAMAVLVAYAILKNYLFCVVWRYA
jgi:hypothetical protein